MTNIETYYTVLGVTQASPPEEIRKAYIRKAAECHPDKVATLDPEIQALARQKMSRINEAWDVLGNPSQRSQYDAYLATLVDPAEKARQDEAAARERRDREEAEKRARKEAEQKAKAEVAKLAADSEKARLAKLMPLVTAAKKTLPMLGTNIRWRESKDDFWDAVYAGTTSGPVRPFVYLKSYTVFGEQELDVLTAFAKELMAKRQAVLLKNFHTIAAVAAEVPNQNEIRSRMKHMNAELVNGRDARKSVTVLLAYLEPGMNFFYLPFSEYADPDLSKLRLQV